MWNCWVLLSQNSLLCRPTPFIFLLWPLSCSLARRWFRSTIHFELSFPPKPTRGSSDPAEAGSKTGRGQPPSLTSHLSLFWAQGGVGRDGVGGACQPGDYSCQSSESLCPLYSDTSQPHLPHLHPARHQAQIIKEFQENSLINLNTLMQYSLKIKSNAKNPQWRKHQNCK